MIDYLTSDKMFGYLVLTCTFGSIAVYYLIFYILLKKGYNMRTRKNQLLLLFTVAYPISILPFLMTPIFPVLVKVAMISFSTGIGLLYYVSLVITGKRFRKYFGIKAPEDKADEEEDERRKKEKEAKK